MQEIYKESFHVTHSMASECCVPAYADTQSGLSAAHCAASPGAGKIFKKSTVFLPMPGRCMIIRETSPGCSNEDHETNQRKAGLQNIRDGCRPRPASRRKSRPQDRACPWHAHLYLARRQGGCAKAVSELAGPVQRNNATRKAEMIRPVGRSFCTLNVSMELLVEAVRKWRGF